MGPPQLQCWDRPLFCFYRLLGKQATMTSVYAQGVQCTKVIKNRLLARVYREGPPFPSTCSLSFWDFALGLGFGSRPGTLVLIAGFTDSLCFCASQGYFSLLFCGSRLLWATGTDLACC